MQKKKVNDLIDELEKEIKTHDTTYCPETYIKYSQALIKLKEVKLWINDI